MFNRSSIFQPERALQKVPRSLLLIFAMALLLHAGIRYQTPTPLASASALDPAPPVLALRMAAIGEPQAAAQLTSLYLQAFDNQPGISLPFATLDYARVKLWLALALALDPNAQYPLMMASQLYGQVDDPTRQRAMCEFVHEAFLKLPDQRWRWLAHCAIMARHRLKDMPLALAYASDIAQHAGKASGWARQMRIFFLEDMGEAERAAVLLGGLLESNTVSDSHELHFLMERLERLRKQKIVEKPTTPTKFR